MHSIQGLGATQRVIGQLLARSTVDGLNVELLTKLNDRLGEARAALRGGDEALAATWLTRAMSVMEESGDEVLHGAVISGDSHGD